MRFSTRATITILCLAISLFSRTFLRYGWYDGSLSNLRLTLFDLRLPQEFMVWAICSLIIGLSALASIEAIRKGKSALIIWTVSSLFIWMGMEITGKMFNLGYTAPIDIGLPFTDGNWGMLMGFGVIIGGITTLLAITFGWSQRSSTQHHVTSSQM